MNKRFSGTVKCIRKDFPALLLEEKQGCIHISGVVEKAEDVVKVGDAAAKRGYQGVLNDVRVTGADRRIPGAKTRGNDLDGLSPRVLVIGGGLLGCAIAREVARYNVSVMIVEKNNDVGLGQTDTLSGNVHLDFSLKKNSLEWYYSAKGYQTFARMVKELRVPFLSCGQLVAFPSRARFLSACLLKRKARAQEVKNAKYLCGEKLKSRLPNLPEWVKSGVFLPSGGVVNGARLCIALAENAVQNGVRLELNTTVEGMTVERGWIKEVQTNRGKITPQIVINAAGMYADLVAEMAEDRTFTVRPQKQVFALLRSKRPVTTELQRPCSRLGDVCVTPTEEGDGLIYKKAEAVPAREESTLQKEQFASLLAEAEEVLPYSKEDVYAYYAGVTGGTYENKLVVRRGINTKNVIEVAGVGEYGLTACPAIAVDVSELAISMLDGAKENFSFNPVRLTSPRVREESAEGLDELVRTNAKYGEIVCACKVISRGEIEDAVHGVIPALTIEGVNRRLGTGQGSCRGGYCEARVAKIIAEEAGIPLEEVYKCGLDSAYVFGDAKGAEL